MKDLLHQIADEKIDVYSENAKFNELQTQYAQTNSKSVRDQLWLIARTEHVRSAAGNTWSHAQ